MTRIKTHIFLPIALLTLGLSACSTEPTIDPRRQQLAADIYAQLAIGYMHGGQFALAEERLRKSQALMPDGELPKEALRQWQSLQPLSPYQDTPLM